MARGWMLESLAGPPGPPPRPGKVLPGGALVAWSPGYRVSFFGIEKLHPFDIGKMDRIAGHLVERGLLGPDDFAIPEPTGDAQLARVHDPAYLASLHRTPVLRRALEVPVPDVFPTFVIERRVLHPFRTAVGGTLAAARGALAHGLGINLGGGFHHARPALGHGFCIYNDVAHAIAALREEGFSGQVLIVDTDVHQGDGNIACFENDPSVFTFSMHQGDLFPVPKLQGDRDVELPAGLGDEGYLQRLDEELAALLPAIKPQLVVQVAGADVLGDDPLAGLKLTPEGLIARDQRVLDAARQQGVPLLYVLAGGYGPSAATAQARSIEGLLASVR